MTQIPLDAPAKKGPPSATFNEVGDFVVVGIVNVGEYQQRNYDTGDLEYWDAPANTQPKMGKVVTGLVSDNGGNVTVGRDAEQRTVQEGDLVTFWCEGGKHYTYRDAVAAAGSVNVGDVMLWKRADDKPSSNPRLSAQKVYVAQIRSAGANDGDLADRCIAAYREMQTRPALDRGPDPFTDNTDPEPEF